MTLDYWTTKELEYTCWTTRAVGETDLTQRILSYSQLGDEPKIKTLREGLKGHGQGSEVTGKAPEIT